MRTERFMFFFLFCFFFVCVFFFFFLLLAALDWNNDTLQPGSYLKPRFPLLSNNKYLKTGTKLTVCQPFLSIYNLGIVGRSR